MVAASLLSMSSSVCVRGAQQPRAAARGRGVSSCVKGPAQRRSAAMPAVRSAIMAPPGGKGDAEQRTPPKPMRNNTNPLSAESARPAFTKAKHEPVRIKIDEQWYDCRGWAAAHPGGERWIHFFDGRDGTDAFYALHSNGKNGSAKAVERLAKLPKCDAPPAGQPGGGGRGRRLTPVVQLPLSISQARPLCTPAPPRNPLKFVSPTSPKVRSPVKQQNTGLLT